jgi:polyhydroxybutyrate depolymerase
MWAQAGTTKTVMALAPPPGSAVVRERYARRRRPAPGFPFAPTQLTPGRRHRLLTRAITVVEMSAAAKVWICVGAALLATGCSHHGKPSSGTPAARAATTTSAPSAAASASAAGSLSPAPARSPAGTSTAAAGSATCATARPGANGTASAEVAVRGAPARRYLRYLPAAYDGLHRLPVVCNFHGYGATSDEQMLYSGQYAVAERKGFVVVAVDGQGDPLHYNVRAATHGGEVSDVQVVVAVLDQVSKSLCLDPKRVYATGMSDGGALAAALGCFASDRFAAVAPVAALIYDPSCAKAKPVPLMAFRGTADEIVPYGGGAVACCGNPVVNPTRQDIASWAKHNGCGPTPAVTKRGAVETSSYTGCTGGADVVLHTVVGGGHTWPGAISLPGLGVTTRDIDASAAMWDFFAAHPKG